jgi:hypothetical protein
LDQVSREDWQSVVLALRPTKFNRHVLTLDVTRLIQTFAKAGDSTRISLGRRATQKSNDGDGRLLGAGTERPHARHAWEHSDEVTPPHLITASAKLVI